MIDGTFRLTDHHGTPVTGAAFLGRFMLVFFGFTHCKVVCPRALSKLSAVLDDLGPLADEIAPLYVSVDPERDHPEVMKAFLEASYPRFTGLTGTREQCDAAKKAFRVFAEKKPDPDDPEGYDMPHTAFAYLLGRDGRYVAHFGDHLDEVQLAERLRKQITTATEVAQP
jgi:protein SCO1/2